MSEQQTKTKKEIERAIIQKAVDKHESIIKVIQAEKAKAQKGK